jgi:hypothetical protein
MQFLRANEILVCSRTKVTCHGPVVELLLDATQEILKGEERVLTFEAFRVS